MSICFHMLSQSTRVPELAAFSAPREYCQPIDGPRDPENGTEHEPPCGAGAQRRCTNGARLGAPGSSHHWRHRRPRSEEHTSELQSRRDLVCRLLLEKKKK